MERSFKTGMNSLSPLLCWVGGMTTASHFKAERGGVFLLTFMLSYSAEQLWPFGRGTEEEVHSCPADGRPDSTLP